MISLQLQLLASQCRLSEVIITETFDVLLSNKLFISKMISQNVMNSQINILIDEAKQAVISREKHNREYFQAFLHTSLVFTALS